jgi:hypothetical protein
MGKSEKISQKDNKRKAWIPDMLILVFLAIVAALAIV